MSKTQIFPLLTNYDVATDLRKLLVVKNQTTQITSGSGPVRMTWFNSTHRDIIEKPSYGVEKYWLTKVFCITC